MVVKIYISFLLFPICSQLLECLAGRHISNHTSNIVPMSAVFSVAI